MKVTEAYVDPESFGAIVMEEGEEEEEERTMGDSSEESVPSISTADVAVLQ